MFLDTSWCLLLPILGFLVELIVASDGWRGLNSFDSRQPAGLEPEERNQRSEPLVEQNLLESKAKFVFWECCAGEFVPITPKIREETTPESVTPEATKFISPESSEMETVTLPFTEVVTGASSVPSNNDNNDTTINFKRELQQTTSAAKIDSSTTLIPCIDSDCEDPLVEASSLTEAAISSASVGATNSVETERINSINSIGEEIERSSTTPWTVKNLVTDSSEKVTSEFLEEKERAKVVIVPPTSTSSGLAEVEMQNQSKSPTTEPCDQTQSPSSIISSTSGPTFEQTGRQFSSTTSTTSPRQDGGDGNEGEDENDGQESDDGDTSSTYPSTSQGTSIPSFPPETSESGSSEPATDFPSSLATEFEPSEEPTSTTYSPNPGSGTTISGGSETTPGPTSPGCASFSSLSEWQADLWLRAARLNMVLMRARLFSLQNPQQSRTFSRSINYLNNMGKSLGRHRSSWFVNRRSELYRLLSCENNFNLLGQRVSGALWRPRFCCYNRLVFQCGTI